MTRYEKVIKQISILEDEIPKIAREHFLSKVLKWLEINGYNDIHMFLNSGIDEAGIYFSVKYYVDEPGQVSYRKLSYDEADWFDIDREHLHFVFPEFEKYALWTSFQVTYSQQYIKELLEDICQSKA